MKQPFELVTDSISHDSVEALQMLLQQAKSGELIGVAFAAMYRKGSFVVNTAGEAHRSPTFARGMIAALDDHLMQRVHE